MGFPQFVKHFLHLLSTGSRVARIPTVIFRPASDANPMKIFQEAIIPGGRITCTTYMGLHVADHLGIICIELESDGRRQSRSKLAAINFFAVTRNMFSAQLTMADVLETAVERTMITC